MLPECKHLGYPLESGSRGCPTGIVLNGEDTAPFSVGWSGGEHLASLSHSFFSFLPVLLTGQTEWEKVGKGALVVSWGHHF